MAEYQKTIAYLDYLENGMKIKNAGFVRIEENGGRMRMEMRVKNIPESINGQYELKADAGGTIGRISLNRGCGSCCVVWNEENEVPRGKRRTQSNGVYVRLPGRRLLQAVWPSGIGVLTEEEERQTAREPEADQGKQEIPEACGAGLSMSEPESVEGGQPPFGVTEAQETRRPLPGAPDAEGAKQKKERGAAAPKVDVQFAQEEPGEQKSSGPKAADVTEGAQPDSVMQDEKEAVCYGDKWEQLSHMYLQIHPFQDDRVYLSIAPKDFVVLRQEYQKMVHNSFLLHGYYNYKHLILGKIKEKDGWCYYLGVPGNFYNREKMVAEMFGFEAFEGERNPARPGDFGYFMKKVEI